MPVVFPNIENGHETAYGAFFPLSGQAGGPRYVQSSEELIFVNSTVHFIEDGTIESVGLPFGNWLVVLFEGDWENPDTGVDLPLGGYALLSWNGTAEVTPIISAQNVQHTSSSFRSG